MRRTFRLTVGYDGTNYAGWQVQSNQPTIQSHLERAVEKLTGTHSTITGSGRTDAGVHALAQIASFSSTIWRDSAEAFGRAINTKIPEDISVYQCEEMPPSFHALRHATGKRYRYCLQAGGVRDPFENRYCWHCHSRLDVELMRQAAAIIVGTHDFKCFQAKGSDRKTTIRTVRELTISEEQGRGERKRLVIEIEGNGFLYNMVRNIVGSLIDVGRGRKPPQWIGELIEGRNRDLAGQTAPPQGLFLVHVDYDF